MKIAAQIITQVTRVRFVVLYMARLFIFDSTGSMQAL